MVKNKHHNKTRKSLFLDIILLINIIIDGCLFDLREDGVYIQFFFFAYTQTTSKKGNDLFQGQRNNL